MFATALLAAGAIASPYGYGGSYGGYGDSYGAPYGGSYGGYGGSYGGYGGYRSYKPAIKYGNDGYRLTPRSDPYEAPRDTTYATCALKDPEEETSVSGIIRLSQPGGVIGHTTIEGELWGVRPGEHGFHIHALGDLTGGCDSLGGHYMPNSEAGAEDDGYGGSAGGHDMGAMDGHDEAHDLEPVHSNYHGEAWVFQENVDVDLWGTHSVIGRSMVLHADPDPDAGARIACCTIGLAKGPGERQKSYAPYNSGYGYGSGYGYNNYGYQGAGYY